MNRGILIFAHNSQEIDYLEMATFSARLAKTNLNLPVALVTDQGTLDWGKSSYYSDSISVFDKIEIIKTENNTNYRVLTDGTESSSVPFINGSRPSSYDVTPWDHTLLIDSDYLIFDETLNDYWNVAGSVKIGKSFSSISGDSTSVLDQYVSPTGIPLRWATTVMFDKSNESKMFFDLVKHIKDNYVMYSELYKFNPSQYRNDISFSIAQHTMNGFVDYDLNLPSIFTSVSQDLVLDINDTGCTLLSYKDVGDEYFPVSVSKKNIHILNKQSLIRSIRTYLGKK